MRFFVYRVTESKNKDFAVGEYVVANVGWVDRVIGTAQNSNKLSCQMAFQRTSTPWHWGFSECPGMITTS